VLSINTTFAEIGGKLHENSHENMLENLIILCISKHPGTGSQKCLYFLKYSLKPNAVWTEILEIVSRLILENLSEI
jgi:hypothetical protein